MDAMLTLMEQALRLSPSLPWKDVSCYEFLCFVSYNNLANGLEGSKNKSGGFQPGLHEVAGE